MAEHEGVTHGEAASEITAHTEVAHGEEHHVEPTAFGIAPGGFVALAMIVVILIMLRAGVPRLIAGMLDGRIAEIRKQLDTASKLREEAEALKQQYEAKAREADTEIADLMAAAERQAKEIVAKAEEDATQLMARHKAVSEAKIAAAEHAAIAELRAKAAEAATKAAQGLIREKHTADADKALVDEVISKI